MDYHQSLKIAGGLVALLLFVPMVLGILKDGADGHSGASWLLWGALDTVLTITIIEQHGNFLLPLGFAIGDVLLVILLLAKGRFQWGRFETVILALVIACIIIWKFSGPKSATIAATLGVCIALLPGLLAMWKRPQRKLGNIWAGYILANVLSFFGGTAMTIEERFAPGVFALCALAMFLASRRKVLNSNGLDESFPKIQA
ncbi:MAG TPA: hypothetical protein VH597_09920 [Verrucomicrobiae bacterium]|jgi:hypothetical protein|nr:hypothetical protein [Verrucomicrobiae bacterium]